ncbi:MAG: kelch repeat-containing protein [Ignavibacteria bacterium]
MANFSFFPAKRILFILAVLLILFANSNIEAQTIFSYDYGTSEGSASSETAANPGFFSTAQGTTFYGFSSTGSTLTTTNPGLLNLGALSEVQCQAGASGQFSKFGIYSFATANISAGYFKFDLILGGSSGTNTSDNGIWYFCAGDGGGSGKFMYNNKLTRNVLETSTTLRWTFNTGGTVTLDYYSFLTSTTGEWINIGTYLQGTKYTVESISNVSKSQNTSYSKYGTTFSLNAQRQDLWINDVRVLTGGKISSINNACVKIDSYCFYGEGSNSAYLFSDDAVYSHNINSSSSASYSYYSKSTGDLNSLGTWGTNADGSGTQPANFTNPNCTYFIRNNSTPTIGANWTVSGINSRIEVGDTVNACNFTIPSAYTVTGEIDVLKNATLTLQNLTLPTFGRLAAGSTVDYAYTGDQNISYPSFYNLKISSTGIKTLATNVKASGTITVGDGTNIATLSIPPSYSLTGTTNVNTNSILDIQNSTNPTLGTLSSGSTVYYNLASNGQNVLAANYYNLKFSDYNKVLPSSGTVGISSLFTKGSATGHTITGSTVLFNGTAVQTIPVFTFNNLSINNSAGATAGGNISVDGILNLQSANPSATLGCFDMSGYTLTMGATATTTGIGDVTGKVKRTTINPSTEYTFGHQVTTISLTPGTMPEYIEVTITLGEDPYIDPANCTNCGANWSYTPIKRRYEIVIPTTADGSYIDANFHYLDGELGVNTESKLVTGDYDYFEGTTPPIHYPQDEHGKSVYDITTSNYKYIGMSNVPIGYFIYVEGSHEWRTFFSMADYTATNYKTWTADNGTTDWYDNANWFDDSGPDENSHVVIPNTAIKPVLSSAAEIQSIDIQNGATLTLNANLTLNGGGIEGAGTFNDVNYGLIPNSNKIIFTGNGATFSGNSNFYEIEIGNNATLTNQLGSLMKISNQVLRTGTTAGKWFTDVHDNTVEYNNDGDQTVYIPDGTSATYHNLILSGSGTKTMPGSAMTLTGSFTVSGSVSADIGAYSHVIKGDFTNSSSGTFTSTGSTITMSGTSEQTIGGTVSSSFYNLVLNNSTGITLSNSNTITNSLTLTNGTLTTGANTLTISGNTVSRTNGNIDASNSGSTLAFTNSSALSLPESVFSGDINNLTLNGAGGVTLNSSATINGDLTLTSGTLSIGSNSLTILSSDITRSSGNIDAGSSTILFTNPTSDVVSLPASIFKDGIVNNLTINSGGSVALGSDLTISGALSLTAGTITAGSNTLAISGNTVSRTTGLINASSATVEFKNTSALVLPLTQIFSGNISNLIMNGSGGVSLGSVITVNETTTLTNGNLTLGGYDLITPTITGGSATSYVLTDYTGRLTLKSIGIEEVTFPVGTSTSYNPSLIKNTGTTSDFSIRVASSFTVSPSDPTKAVPRIWDISPSVTGTECTIKFTINTSDYTSFDPASTVVAGHYMQSVWMPLSASISGSGPYTITTSGVKDFSPFAVGNLGAFTLYSQNFDGDWINGTSTRDLPDANWVNTPATGFNSWRQEDDGKDAAGWTTLAGTVKPYGNTGHSANFHTYESEANATGTLDLKIDLSAVGTKILTFDYINASGNDKLEIFLSTDNGANFGSALSTFTTGTWAQKSVDLGATTSSTCIVRFQATSDFGNTDIGIDNVNIRLGNTSLSDAGALSVDISSVVSPGTISPKATIKNFGTTDISTAFNVTLYISGASYASTKSISSLSAGATTQVTFDDWTATIGSYTSTICTELTDDQDPSNDCLDKDISVSSSGSWSNDAVSYSLLLGSGVGYSNGSTNYIFSVGGFTSTGNKCYRYDVNSKTWDPITDLPELRVHLATAIVGDSLYAIGGMNSAHEYTTTVYRYDISKGLTGTWKSREPVPYTVGWGRAISYGNKIYLAGGCSGTSSAPSFLKNVYVYDVDANTWAESTPLPEARFGGGFAIYGTTLVYVGGAVSNSALSNTVYTSSISGGLMNSLSEWKVSANTFPGNGKPVTLSSSSKLSEPSIFSKSNKEEGDDPKSTYPAGSMYGLDAATWNGGIIVGGGASSDAFLPNDPSPYYFYDPAEDEWTSQPNIITPVTGSSSGSVLNGTTWKFVLASGLTPSGYSTATQVWTETFSGDKMLNITSLLEGYYTGMKNSKSPGINVTVELRESNSPFSLIESHTVLLNESGFASIPFNNIHNNNPFYVVVKYLNGLETWSSAPQRFTDNILNYDFTTALTQAYGNNLVKIGDKFCVYSGDINQDGSINAIDWGFCWNDRGLTGLQESDLNGDGNVNELDRTILSNNKSVSAKFPSGFVPSAGKVRKSSNSSDKVKKNSDGVMNSNKVKK